MYIVGLNVKIFAGIKFHESPKKLAAEIFVTLIFTTCNS